MFQEIMTILHKHIIAFFVLLSVNLAAYSEIISGVLQIIVLIIAAFVGIKTLMLRSTQTKTEMLEQKLHKLKLEGVMVDDPMRSDEKGFIGELTIQDDDSNEEEINDQ